MKRDSTNTATDNFKNHPLESEESSLKETVMPGRSGGTFNFPLGAKLKVCEGTCSKKDNFVCKAVSPSQRWRYKLAFDREHLTSEIFILSGSANVKRKSVIFDIPYNPLPDKFQELNVKGMWKDEHTWINVGFIPQYEEERQSVELHLDRLGTFMVTFRPKSDQFEMTPYGGLFYSRINRNICLRFPKKAVDTTINYNLQIKPVADYVVSHCQEYFPLDCADVVAVSAFVYFNPDVTCDFRRSANVKLPLPSGVEVQSGESDEIVVLRKSDQSTIWELVDTRYKYSRNTVTVLSKNPYSFCVVKSKPNRHNKMQFAATQLERCVDVVFGEIGLFLSLQPKSWMLLVEVYPCCHSEHVCQKRLSQGFQVISKKEIPSVTTSAFRDTVFKSLRASTVKNAETRANRYNALNLTDGMRLEVSVNHELKAQKGCDIIDDNVLCYFRYVNESFRRIFFEPTLDEEKQVTAFEMEDSVTDGYSICGTEKSTPTTAGNIGSGQVWPDMKGMLTLKQIDAEGSPMTDDALTVEFQLDINGSAVRDYYFVAPTEREPKPKRAKPKFDHALLPRVPNATTKSATESGVARKRRTFSQGGLDRLTQPIRKAPVTEREARVINGRSLMTLSKIVNEGLTLAVYLGLPESTITGIGFDTLSSGRGMAELGYKILLYWKRTCRNKNDEAVQQLVSSLRSMGKSSVADVVLQQHRLNKELSMECFLQSALTEVRIAA